MLLEPQITLNYRYQLEAKLGANGARQTWLATDQARTELEAKVIVKTLYFGQGMEWQDYKLFERESETLQSLTHPQIPCYRGAFRHEVIGGVYYGLVHDYIPGRSLAECVRAGQRFSEAEVKQMASSILEILVDLHGRYPPVIHRDIKPSNLILGDDQMIHLVDFGSVQTEGQKGKTVTVVGTYGYMPLEQFGGRAVPASDLYALGATILYLLTGIEPADFPQDNLRINMDSVHFGYTFKKWLEQMLEPNLERRFGSAEQALSALTQTQLPQPVPTIDPTPRILLQSSPAQLDIVIPPRASQDTRANLRWIFSGIQLLFTGLLALNFLLMTFASPWFILGVVWQGGWLWFWGDLFTRASKRSSWRGFYRILINSREVSVWYSQTADFNQPQPILQRKTDQIVGVEVAADQDVGEISFRIQLQNCIQERAFGKGLTKDEQHWLIGQIRQWLQKYSR